MAPVNKVDGCGQLAAAGEANGYQVGGSHYRSPVQHWDYVVANQIPYLEAQVIKYLTRWREKGGHQDLKKGQHFLKKLFETQEMDWFTGESRWDQREREIKEATASSEYLAQAGGGQAIYGGPVPTRDPYKR